MKLMGELLETSPGFRALVLTESTERANFARAMKAGVSGVLRQDCELLLA